MSILIDNPVARLMLLRIRRTGGRLATVLVPALFALFFVLSAPILDTGSLPWSGGEFLFVVLLVMFWMCVVAASLFGHRDPVVTAVHEATGEQFVLTGITPLTWACGHVLAALFECLVVFSAFLPPAVLCWYLGGVSGRIFSVLGILGVVLCVSLRLAFLLVLRSPVVGAIAFLWLFLCLVVLPFFGLGSWPAAVSFPLISLSSMSPLAVLLHNGGGPAFLPLAFLERNSWVALFRAAFSHATLGRYIAGHALFWFFCLMGIVVGRPRSQVACSDTYAVQGASRRGGKWTAAAGFGAGEGEGRRASFGTVMRLFHENSDLHWRGLWEFLWLLMVTLVAGLAAFWVLTSALTWASSTSWALSLSWVSWFGVVLSLVLLSLASMDLCHCGRWVDRDWHGAVLLVPVALSFLVRCILILAGLFVFLRAVPDVSVGSASELLCLCGLFAVCGVIWCWRYSRFRDRFGAQMCLLSLFLSWLVLPPVIAVAGCVILPGPAVLMRVGSLSPAWACLGYFLPADALVLSRTGLAAGVSGGGPVELLPTPLLAVLASVLVFAAAIVLEVRSAASGGEEP